MKNRYSAPLGATLMACFLCVAALQAHSKSFEHEESVYLENEIVSLAEGFADAFAEIADSIVYIELKTKTGSRYLSGVVRSIKANKGVLIIRMSKGTVHIVSAKDIASITTENPQS